MAKKVKKKKIDYNAMDEKIQELAEAYGIKTVSPYQVVDHGYDLSTETVSSQYSAIVASMMLIKGLWQQYGSKPNILIDSKLLNLYGATKNLDWEMQVLCWANIKNQGIEWKSKPEYINDFNQIDI